MKDLCIRTKKIALCLIENSSTVREVAKMFGISKSTVHYDLTKRLPKYDLYLYEKVRQILDLNFQEKNIRGGIATKEKYKRIIKGKKWLQISSFEWLNIKKSKKNLTFLFFVEILYQRKIAKIICIFLSDRLSFNNYQLQISIWYFLICQTSCFFLDVATHLKFLLLCLAFSVWDFVSIILYFLSRCACLLGIDFWWLENLC